MTRIIDWAGAHARMIMAFIALSLAAGGFAYTGLPKEGEPDIEIPALFISVPFSGISAEDSEKLLVKPLESKLQDLDGLKEMSATAAEGYAGVALEFEFGWDKTKVIADVREKVNQAEAEFPDGADSYTINEINFSEFPIAIVTLSGDIPERTMTRVAKDLQDRLESLSPILEARLTGHRDEMVEVIVEPSKLESYNITAGELIGAVRNNNLLIAAGDIKTPQGEFSVKIPSSFNSPSDLYGLPIKASGDRIVTLQDLADIRLRFEDPTGFARFNGKPTIALQIIKRQGFNVIDTVQLVRETIGAERVKWPPELRRSLSLDLSLDQSKDVASMVSQLEGSVLTAVALVMIVILAALGARSALLVGFAVPTSFMLCFALLAVMEVAISNMVMFGLILAVGMLVDGAIVVVEFADKRIKEGVGPMRAYGQAAKRMFWPIVSSTATTLCAFLPMLFWPGIPGQFMSMLPITLIFVLSASLIVALVYLPVVGGVAGRLTRSFDRAAAAFSSARLFWRVLALLASAATLYLGFRLVFGAGAPLLGLLLFIAGCAGCSIASGSLRRPGADAGPRPGYRRTAFGKFISMITRGPLRPLVAIGAVVAVIAAVFMSFAQNNKGVEFFVETEPEQFIVYVKARGNLSLDEKDALVRQTERLVSGQDGVKNVFAFSGSGGLSQNTGGASVPLDTVGQVQVELLPWDERRSGDEIIADVQGRLESISGFNAEIFEHQGGPASGKPLSLRVRGDDWDSLLEAARIVREKLGSVRGVTEVEDTTPLPGIDWQIDVDIAKASRFGADVSSVGGMVQLVTRGLQIDKIRLEGATEEIDIKARVPESDRLFSTLDSLRIRTSQGMVPISNFITRTPVPKLGQINRVDTERFFDIKADVAEGLVNESGMPINPNERIGVITEWLESETPLPAGIKWEWTGDQEDQAESQAFLGYAFLGALGLMFVILLAQFNSFYSSVLVLLAVILSTTGVLVGMLVMQQPFSVIMTGTGIVALAGIVVNNNIVLIDTYLEYSTYMSRLEAIVRTAEARIRPVLLTTITTMAGLTPMVFGLSIDFIDGGYTINAPSSLWWKQLATAVVFGLGVATALTLVLTPSLLALRVWVSAGAYGFARGVSARALGAGSATARDRGLGRSLSGVQISCLVWEDSKGGASGVAPVYHFGKTGAFALGEAGERPRRRFSPLAVFAPFRALFQIARRAFARPANAGGKGEDITPAE